MTPRLMPANGEHQQDRGRRSGDRGALQAHYQQLVELAPDAIVIHDGECIVFANAAAMRLAGATQRDQVVGQPMENFLDPPYLKAVAAELVHPNEVAALQPPVRDRFRRLDGGVTQVEVSAIGFVDRRLASVHLVIRDITERLFIEQRAHRAEEHLHQAQKMEAVGALAGGVAHEVNNMMMVILGFAEWLLRDDAVRPERAADVREIVKAADRAASVTRQVLAFSRRAFRHAQVVDLAAAVAGLEPLIRRLLGAGHRLEVVSTSSPNVVADPGQLEQVIVNLILNARDATPDGGTITITTAEADVPDGAESTAGIPISAGRYAALTVRDTGVGMDAATQARAFEPFFTTKPVGQGSGLGLAAVDGIMRQNGGHVTVNSTLGEGSAFTLYLPVTPGVVPVEQRATAPPPRETPQLPGATVLVVEDEPAVRTIASRNLERGGFRVLQAADGAAALEIVDRFGPPNLVLTDMMMPGMSGAELSRRLKERWPALPILFMSGYSEADLRRQGATDFAGDLIEKPFSPETLIGRVVDALSVRDQNRAAGR